MLWIFDLDNTLHHASPGVFPHINRMMTDYIIRHLHVDEDAANRLRQHYWTRYGATLTGLVRHHGVDPRHFLRHTHPLEDLLPLVETDPQVARTLARLPGRKVLLSNGPAHYCAAVLTRLGIDRHFSAQFGLEHIRFAPKPSPHGFRAVLSRLRARPGQSWMIEDSADNLKTAKRLGLNTVWLAPGELRRPAYVDHRLNRLSDLVRLVR